MGPSRQVERVAQQVERVAASPLTVLVQGETGTGKELVARAIHRLSARREDPFVALDCGAIPETLIESALFGHEKGAFTGADQRREGHLQRAGRGTLFLDEIVNLPLSAQPTLLRALQERAVQPLGGMRPVPLHARIVAASNVPLENAVGAGRFRQDLYYRLREFSITLPPFRERPEDILHVANRFLVEARTELRRPIRGLSDDAAELLLRYPWPGNGREIRNTIRQAVLLGRDLIRPDDISFFSSENPVSLPRSDADGAQQPERSLKSIAAAAAAEAERQAIRKALKTAQGNKSVVARLLRVDYKTLHLKMKRYGIAAQDFRTA